MRPKEIEFLIHDILVNFAGKGIMFTAFDILKAAKKETRSKFVIYSTVKQIIDREFDNYFGDTFGYRIYKVNIDLGVDTIEEDLYYPLCANIEEYIEEYKKEKKREVKVMKEKIIDPKTFEMREVEKIQKIAKELNNFVDKLDASENNDDVCYNQHTLYGIPFEDQPKEVKVIVEKYAKEPKDVKSMIINQKIQEFVAKKLSFSAFDLTKALNQDDISIKYVRNVLAKAYADGSMKNYKRKYISNTDTCSRTILYYDDNNSIFNKETIPSWNNKKAAIEEQLMNDFAKMAEGVLIDNPLKEAKEELKNFVRIKLDNCLFSLESMLENLRYRLDRFFGK